MLSAKLRQFARGPLNDSIAADRSGSSTWVDTPRISRMPGRRDIVAAREFRFASPVGASARTIRVWWHFKGSAFKAFVPNHKRSLSLAQNPTVLCPLACWGSIASRQYRCRFALLVFAIAWSSECLWINPGGIQVTMARKAGDSLTVAFVGPDLGSDHLPLIADLQRR
jgi:hypothetical protein